MPTHIYKAFTTVNTSTTLERSMRCVGAYASAATLTLTLPDVDASEYHEFRFKKLDSSAFPVLIRGGSGALVDGAAFQSLVTINQHFDVVSTGISWLVY